MELVKGLEFPVYALRILLFGATISKNSSGEVEEGERPMGSVSVPGKWNAKPFRA